MAEGNQYFCSKCRRTMGRDQFYVSNNTEKYPDGVMGQCKKCLTMHVDNWNPETFLWILQEADVPYVQEEWNKLMVKYAKDPAKINGTTIMGRYLAKMRLNQWNKYRWDDTEFLQKVRNNDIEQTMKRQGYDAQQIAEVLEQGAFRMPNGEIKIPDNQDEIVQPQIPPSPAQEAVDLGLTDEDIKYLRIKWGNYRPEEWVSLEQLYSDMMESYDIQSAGDKNTLILACKASLKANQLLDLADIEGSQKAAKMYEMLMKAGKWTAAQNKTEENELIDSVGELIAICEKDGFIPVYYQDTPNDKVDRVIQDMQNYTRTLINDELGLGNMIENALRNIEDEREHIEAAGKFAEAQQSQSEEDALFDYDKSVLEDSDFEEFEDFQDGLEESDFEEFIEQQKG